MRMRKKPNLVPRMERCAATLITDPEALRGHWLEHFPGYQALHLELGCGKGRFTADTAAQSPDIFLAAIEKVPDAMVVGMERVTERGLKNVRFLDRDAINLLDIFAPGEVSRIYINFPDPWKKSRQHKRRLTYAGFLALYANVLPLDGEIWFKTDNDPLFAFSLEQFEQEGWELREVTHDLHANGLRACVTKGFADTFRALDADIFCLQETKLQPGQITLDLPGYHQYWCSAEKKGYSGTAVFTKAEPLDVQYNLGLPQHDLEGRVITAEYPEFYLVCVYTPNAQDGLRRLEYRMHWDDAFREFVCSLDRHKPASAPRSARNFRSCCMPASRTRSVPCTRTRRTPTRGGATASTRGRTTPAGASTTFCARTARQKRSRQPASFPTFTAATTAPWSSRSHGEDR